MANAKTPDKSLESSIWDAACSIRGAKDAPKYKEFILPLIFTKRLCDKKLVRRTLSDKIGEHLTTHGQRDIDDARLSNLIEAISAKRRPTCGSAGLLIKCELALDAKMKAPKPAAAK